MQVLDGARGHCLQGSEEEAGAQDERSEATMRATVGDRIRVPGRHVGNASREGEVTAVRGSEDAPLYVVRWDDGHEGVCSPGPEARVDQPSSS